MAAPLMCYIWWLCCQVSKSIRDTSLCAACWGGIIPACSQWNKSLYLNTLIVMVTHLIATEMSFHSSGRQLHSTCEVIVIIIINIWRSSRKVVLHLRIAASIVDVKFDAFKQKSRSAAYDPF